MFLYTEHCEGLVSNLSLALADNGIPDVALKVRDTTGWPCPTCLISVMIRVQLTSQEQELMFTDHLLQVGNRAKRVTRFITFIYYCEPLIVEMFKGVKFALRIRSFCICELNQPQIDNVLEKNLRKF